MRDASAFAGRWPFGLASACTVADAASQLGQLGYSGAAISPLDAVLAPDPAPANQALHAAVWAAAGFAVSPVPIANLSLAGWARQLEVCPGASAVRILPNYHGYPLDGPAVDDLADTLAARGATLCVQLRMLDERSHHRLMPVPAVQAAELGAVARRHPGLTILACGIYARELDRVADIPNIHVEISFVENGWMPASLLDAIPIDRILIGTHFPIHNPQAAIAKLWPSDMAEDALAQIADNNFQRLFK